MITRAMTLFSLFLCAGGCAKTAKTGDITLDSSHEAQPTAATPGGGPWQPPPFVLDDGTLPGGGLPAAEKLANECVRALNGRSVAVAPTGERWRARGLPPEDRRRGAALLARRAAQFRAQLENGLREAGITPASRAETDRAWEALGFTAGDRGDPSRVGALASALGVDTLVFPEAKFTADSAATARIVYIADVVDARRGLTLHTGRASETPWPTKTKAGAADGPPPAGSKNIED